MNKNLGFLFGVCLVVILIVMLGLFCLPLSDRHILRFDVDATNPREFDPKFVELDVKLTICNVGQCDIHNVYLEYERYGGFSGTGYFSREISVGDIAAGEDKIVFLEKFFVYWRLSYNPYTDTFDVYADRSFTIRADEGYIHITDHNFFNKEWTLKPSDS